MAEKTHVVTLDDIDGTPNAKRYHFGWAGKTYEIDLADENGKALAEAFAPYIKAATVVHEAPEKMPRTVALARVKARREAIRAWAHERGLPVARRGEPAAWLVEQYEAEQAAAAAK